MAKTEIKESAGPQRVLRIVKKRRASRTRELSPMDQVSRAFRLEAALPTSFGIALGGFIPVGVYVICHHELAQIEGWRWWTLAGIALGGLLFSAKTVWQWTRAAFGDPYKATGFVLLVEGILVFSVTPALSYAALGILCVINATASAVRLGRRP